MICAVPGCRRDPEHAEQVKGSTAEELRHLVREAQRGQVPGELCALHRAEFEALGWLAPRQEDDE